jgi:hypothetical protein
MGHSIAFVGDAFYVADTTNIVGNAYQLQLKRIETDGTITTVIDALPGAMVSAPVLATGAGDLRVVYADVSRPVGAYVLQKVDARGGAVGSATALDSGGAPHYYGAATAIAMGTDIVALLSAAVDNALTMMRIGATGATVTPPFTVAKWPDYSYPLALARRGSEVVVVWFSGVRGSRIRIARVTP